MAQKKLLFPLILLMMFIQVAQASDNEDDNEEFSFKKDDIEFARDLTKRTVQMSLSDIKAKWFELQNMLKNHIVGTSTETNNIKDDAANFDDDLDGVSFRIFVSSSMSKNLLKTYAIASKKYNATLVFNGLPGGSWHKLSELVTEISGNDPELVAMQIDDEAFKEFNISSVPTFILSKEEDVFASEPKVTFDKVVGSIGTRRALELFEEKGELSDIAASKLERARE